MEVHIERFFNMVNEKNTTPPKNSTKYKTHFKELYKYGIIRLSYFPAHHILERCHATLRFHYLCLLLVVESEQETTNK